MKILIVGAGEVGYHLAQRLSHEKLDVVVIEQDAATARHVQEHLDVQVLVGSGASPGDLRQAGVEQSDMVVAVTNSDEVNVVACLIAASQARTPTKIARIRNTEFFSHTSILGRDFLNVDYAINPEAEVVHTIERLLEIPAATDLAEFARGKVLVVGFRIPEESPIAGLPLKDLWTDGSPPTRLLIAAIYRDRKVLIPRGNDEIQPGDVIMVVHRADQIREVYPMIGVRQLTAEMVVIAGASRVGVELARALERRKGLTVKLISRRRDICERLSEELESTLILHGDPTDEALLAEEHIGQASVFVAAGGRDEYNILVSLLARNQGVPRVITLVNQVSYIPLVQAVGIQVAICPKMVAVSQILQFIRRGRVLSVATMRDESAEALEVLAVSDSDLVHRPLQELRLPRGVIVGAIIRRDEVIIPGGVSTINPGDHVVFFSTRQALPKLERLVDVRGGV